MMKYTTFGDLGLGLRDLFQTKADLAGKAVAFQIYREPLKAKYVAIDSLRRALGGRPLSEEIGSVDGVHDSSGRALFFIRKGVAELLDLDASIRTAVDEIVDKVVPTLSSLTESYEDEAAHAGEKRKVLEENTDFLAAFPVGPKHTLKSILTTHVEAGEKLEKLLSKRADTVAEDTAGRTAEAKILRSQTIGLLNRFRQAVADEVEHNLALPRDLEAKIFTYFDQMEANRQARYGKPESDETETKTPSI
jgi:hypothetical protein